ncbi:MAG: hypothetical protein KME26_11515 [Oscillatoria princeps RMCB-10]|jgi:hypothetical protein|nr:hypothetical protein [Oscillatoria princeps RMCB-10]
MGTLWRFRVTRAAQAGVGESRLFVTEAALMMPVGVPRRQGATAVDWQRNWAVKAADVGCDKE